MRAVLTAAVVGFMLSSLDARAEVTVDNQIWLSGAVRTELIDDLKLGFTQHVRFANDAKDLERVIPELDVSYGLLEYLEVGLGGRYAFEKDEDGQRSQRLRVFGDLGVEAPALGPIELGYRLRLQRETGAEVPAKGRLRNKLSLGVSTGTMFKPGAFYEHFMDPSGESGHKAQKYRAGLGVGVKLSQEHRVKIKLHQDTEIDGDGDKERVISLGYRYSF